jgi:recombination protein RecT
MKDLTKTPAVRGRIDELLGKRSAAFCSTLIQMSNLPHLRDCTPTSLLGAAMTAAALDLPVNPNLGFAYMVPYNNRNKDTNQVQKEAQFQMGYRGFIQLAQRTGQYKKMNDAVIPAGCLKSYNELTGELVVDFDSPDRDDLAQPDGYAFHFELLNGFIKTVFWSTDRMEKHAKRYSQTYKNGYGNWADNFDAMALKTVIKLTLGKYGILSVDIQKALETDQSVVDPLTDEVKAIDYVDNLEEAGEVSEAPAAEEAKIEDAPEFNRKKCIATLKVLEKKREDDFNTACNSADIPVAMWAEAPDEILAGLMADLTK